MTILQNALNRGNFSNLNMNEQALSAILTDPTRPQKIGPLIMVTLKRNYPATNWATSANFKGVDKSPLTLKE